MKPERWGAVRRVLEEARERTGAERDDYLGEACTGDGELRAEVERLLALETDDETLAAPAADELHAALAGPDVALDVIDGHRLVRVIASGGMGTVWEAEQHSPRRTVALKLVRSGRLSEAARARFRHETEVLARLGHPAIARLFAAGVQARADGQELPWYTMELVPGARTIHAYAREQRLDLRARLELFAQVCDAVHHAHQHGVIHRDLKPGNILVDEHGRPRVIDFGVARSLDPDVTRHETGAGEIVGTLHAMAPEQLEGHVDARSDVYALGVVLYELLCDRLPLELESRSFTDVVRSIKHELPAPPSLHAAGLPEELDWIVGRALEKRPDERYASAAALGADVGRWLAGEAVVAGAPGALYHARVFVRRHRVAVLAGAVVLAALVVGIVGTTRGMIVARDAEEAARESAAEAERAQALEVAAREQAERARTEEQRARLAADEARADAVSEAATARAALDLLIDLFESPDPRVAGHDVRVVDALARADGLLAERLADAPEAEAELRLALGRLLLNLSLFDEALRHFDAALERGAGGGLDPEAVCDALQWRGIAHLELGHLEAAERDLRRDLELRRERHGDAHPRTAQAMSAVARMCIEQARFAEGEQLLAQAIAVDLEHHGPEHLRTVLDISSLGSLYQTQGRFAEAEPLLEEAVRLAERAELPDVRLVGALGNLAMNRVAQGRPAEALPAARRVYASRLEQLPPEHDLTLLSQANLAAVLITLGELDEAGDLLQRACELRGAHHAPGTFDAMANWLTLGLVRLRQGDEDGLRAALAGALADHEASTKDSLRASTSFEHLAVEVHQWCVRNSRRDLHPLTDEILLPAIEIRRNVLGPEHPSSLMLEVRLLSWIGGRGKWGDARDQVQHALVGLEAIRARVAASGDQELLGSVDHERGAMLSALGRHAEAVALLSPWVEFFDRQTRDGADFRDTLADAYEAWGRLEDAARVRRGP